MFASIFPSVSVMASVVVAIMGALLSLFESLKTTGREYRQRRFREQLIAALQIGEVSWSDIQHLAERWKLSRSDLAQSLRAIFSMALSNEKKELGDHLQKIRNLLEEYEQKTPFDELPENISLQLQTLAQLSQNAKPIASNLARSLTDIYERHERRARILWHISIWGFVIGAIGLFLTIGSLAYTIRESISKQNVSHVQTPPP
jgi:type VI protein secretion system component VasF